MGKDLDEIGKWSEDKLSLLGKYLNAYTTIMKKQRWCKGYYYVDAFAAIGRHKAKEAEKYIDGSPRVALKIKNPFTGYYFIEKDSNKIKKLQELKKEFHNRNISIDEGDCNQVLRDKIIPRFQNDRFLRAFVFLDPYGLDVEMKTLKEIAKTKAMEAFINFPVMPINRTIRSSNPDIKTRKEIERMNRVMGDEKWADENFVDQIPLFEDMAEIPIPRDWQNWVTSYKNRLRQIFPEVGTPLVMRNNKKAPLYALIFAGHKAKARKIMDDIFKKYQRLGS